MFVTKPCEKCGVPVRDQDVPNYRPWTCYYCHCLLTGRDPKNALNVITQMMKLGQLVQRKENKSMLSRFLWWLSTTYGKFYIWRHGQRPAENRLSKLAMKVRYGLPPRIE